MFFSYYKKTIYKKTIKTTSADGKVVEEVVEQTSGPEAEVQAKKMGVEMDTLSKKMDAFFKKMDEAFKEINA